jgi:hypothetical protein
MATQQLIRQRRAIVERDPLGRRWKAWFDDEPQHICFADEALAAFDRLVDSRRHRIPEPYQLKIDDQASRGGHIEVVLWSREASPQTCPACHGSGKYVGLSVVEDCRTCGGSGEVFA